MQIFWKRSMLLVAGATGVEVDPLLRPSVRVNHVRYRQLVGDKSAPHIRTALQDTVWQ